MRRRVRVTVTHYTYTRPTHRFARFIGLSPWNGRRFAVSAWVFMFLEVMSASVWAGLLYAAASAAAWRASRHWDRRTAAAAERPVPGNYWCDHCAAWTLHETEQH